MDDEVAAWKADEPEMEYQIAHALRELEHEVRLLGVRDDATLEYLLPGLLEPKATAIPAHHLWRSRSPATRRSARRRFGQGAIAAEFVEGRELYVSMLGNERTLEILPITEMVFDKRKTRPEERIATQLAKWDDSYPQRKGIRNVARNERA